MHFLRIWLMAARPKTLIAGLSPVLIGTTLALSEGSFNLLLFLLTLLTIMGIQIVTNFANDYFDFLKGADTIERKGPMRVMQAGLVHAKQMRQALIIVSTITFLIGCALIYRGGLIFALLLIVSLILAFLYTGGPYPLAYLGLSDLFVFIFFGPIAVASTYYLQSHVFSFQPCLIGCSPGLFSMAILIANNVRDIQEDKKANRYTLPVRFGKAFGQWQYICTLFLALVPILFFYKSHPFSLLTLLILLPAWPLIQRMHKQKNHDPIILNQIFFQTGKLLWIFTFLFCFGWMLSTSS